MKASFVPTGPAEPEHRNGKWYARLNGYDAATGKRSRPRIGTYPTKRAAQDAQREALNRAKSGTVSDPSMTVERYLLRWLKIKEKQLSENTFSDYSTIIRRYIIPRIGKMPLASVDEEVLSDLYGEVAKHGARNRPAPSQARHVHQVLHAALGDARSLPHNPAHGIAPRKPKPNTEAYTERELNEFLGAAQDHLLGALFIVAAVTGLRREELLGLEWRDVDFDAEMLVVGRITRTQSYELFDEPDERGRRGRTVISEKRGGKTEGSTATMPLPEEAIKALRHHRKLQLEARAAAGASWHRSDWVFTDEVGLPVKPDRASKAMPRIAKAAGLRPLTPHALRRTFATVAMAHTEDPTLTALLLRHNSTAMLKVYQRPAPEHLRAASKRITAGIKPTRNGRRTYAGKRRMRRAQ